MPRTKKPAAVEGPPSAAEVVKERVTGLLPAERGPVEPTGELPPTHPRKGRKPLEAAPTPPLVQMRAPGIEYPHILVPRKVEAKQLVTAIVKVEPGGLNYSLQFMAAENLEPSKPCEQVPGVSFLLRMKRVPRPGEVTRPEGT